MKQIIKLFANCIPIKGYSQSLIYDLERPNNSRFIPNDFYNILDTFPNKSIYEIKKHFNFKFDKIIDGYFDYLLANKIAYKFNENELFHFPEIENIWKSPSIITNAVILIKNFNVENINTVTFQLSKLRCDAIQLCFLEYVSYNQIEIIGELIENSRILSVELLFNLYNEHDVNMLCQMINKYPRFQKFFIGNANSISSFNNKIFFNSSPINFCENCGKVSWDSFSISLNSFFEAQQFNLCLNRKISIDEYGNIKNCPFMKENYGNINTVSLSEVVNNSKFKRLWYINKDKIDICKDCEFRYMCIDCRYFIKKTNNIFSHPTKCTYNPYICKWEYEIGFIPIEECGIYNFKNEFIPDKIKISNFLQQD